MYLGVDVGGTKTLLAVFDGHGEIVEQTKFPTPKDYDHWLLELRHAEANFKQHDYKAAGVGLPGIIDRKHGRGQRFGNLPWHDVNAVHDLEQILHCPVVIENDAKLAGLSEALLEKNHPKVLYLTFSTGVGVSIVADGEIDTNISDAGGADLFIEHRDKRLSWDDFISGRAIVERYGKRASDIDDEATWRKIVRDMAKVIMEMVAVTDPDVIIIGGSVGTHFEKYGELLAVELKTYDLPLLSIPPLRKAQRPEEAVIYGAYELAKRSFAHAAAGK